MFEGVRISHRLWGEGKIEDICNGYITAEFAVGKKAFVFPDSMDLFLTTQDRLLLDYTKECADDNAKIIEQKKEEKQKKHGESKIKFSNGGESGFETPLLGKKSMDIAFSSDSVLYEVIGYLAKPGRIAYYQAEIPDDDRLSLFEKLFPDQEYKVIKESYGQNGIITKQGCQFRINLASIHNCPSELLKNVSERNGTWAGRINRSKFALRLVQNYGFKFGHYQDANAIRKEVLEKYSEDFERGFRL